MNHKLLGQRGGKAVPRMSSKVPKAKKSSAADSSLLKEALVAPTPQRLDSNGLRPREAAVVAEVLERGVSSDRKASQIMEKPAVQRAILAEMEKAGITDKLLARKLRRGMDATEVKFFAHEGNVTDSREVVDWSTRHKYLETALKVRGDVGEAKGGVPAVVQYVSFMEK